MLFAFQQGGLGRTKKPGGGGGGATYSPWNVSSLPSNVTASESNYRLTKSGGGSSTRIVQHSVTRSTGLFEVRFLVRSTGGASVQGPAIGFVTGSPGGYLGQTLTSVSFWPNSVGTAEYSYQSASSTSFGDVASFVADTETTIWINLTTGNAWFGLGNTPISGSPVAGTGPHRTFTPGSAWALTADMYYDGHVKLLRPFEFSNSTLSGYTAGWPD